MELKEYLNILKKNLALTIALTVTGLLIGLISARSLPEGYQASQTFFLTSTQSPNPQDVNFGYYNQEKARNFTDTALAIVQSPDFKSYAQLSAAISAKKVAPQIIRITATAASAQDTLPQLTRTKEQFNSKLAMLGEGNLKIQEVGSNQEPHLAKVNAQVTAAAGAIFGFAAAILALSLKTYFRI